eukprot:293981-Prymnesium_polylepis.1
MHATAKHARAGTHDACSHATAHSHVTAHRCNGRQRKQARAKHTCMIYPQRCPKVDRNMDIHFWTLKHT